VFTEAENPTPAPPSPPNRPRLLPRSRLWRDVIEIVLLVVITYTPINLMTARAIVEGPSMQPNFVTGQLVIVNRSAYFFSAPARGDVVVLHNPSSSVKDDLIKRVIGLPGETLELRAGQVYINGMPLEEPYIKNPCGSNCNGKWELGPDQYFIMGDNRPNSSDSRGFGPINKGLIVGQAWIRYWPLPDFEIVPHPNYNLQPPAPGSALPTAEPTTTPTALLRPFATALDHGN
jgi:signal peptidase I